MVARWVGRAIGLDVHRDFCVVAICEDGMVRLADLPSEVRRGESTVAHDLGTGCAGGCELRDGSALERETLVQCIRECDGNMSRTAERLGMSRNTLYRRCKRLDIPLQHSRD